MKRIITVFTLIAVMAVCSSASAQNWGQIAGSIIGGAQQMAEASKDITLAEEYYIGRAVAAMVLEKYPLYENQSANTYLNKVGYAVARNSDMPMTYGDYHFYLLDTPEINAFACPGGIIFVTRGLMKEAQNEDQLANVLGHEVTHVAKRHGISAIKKSRWTKFAFYAAGEVGKHYTPSEVSQLVGEFQNVVSEVAKTVIEKGYSQSDENDADKYGMVYAMNSGYDPNAMAEFIKHEIALGVGDKSGPFSSHLKPDQRLKKVEATIKSDGLTGTVDPGRTARFKAATGGL